MFIDEAQHLTKMSSGRRLVDQLDVIKSIADHTGSPHVLIGTYDLLAFRNLNGQLSRRSLTIHLGRYRADQLGDAAIFINVVRSFGAHLPLKSEDEFTMEWEFLYERSIGCVGILKDWLVQALSMMLRCGGQYLERRDLEAFWRSASREKCRLRNLRKAGFTCWFGWGLKNMGHEEARSQQPQRSMCGMPME